MKNIEVSLAVLFYQDQYLLGFRHGGQHQGNRYEFIGGKIEDSETAEQALFREVYEEVGVDINKNPRHLLGIVEHEYAVEKKNIANEVQHNEALNKIVDKTKTTVEDKQTQNAIKVRLHVYHIELTSGQFRSLSQSDKGQEGQRITWVNKTSLLANDYRLPEANAEILQWLSM